MLRSLGEDERPDVYLLEPDLVLADEARCRLLSLGLSCSLVNDDDLKDGKRHVSHVLASHVIYYLLPLKSWLEQIRTCLQPEGLLTLVIRGEDCDTYRLRQFVRGRNSQAPRLSRQGLIDDLLAC